MSFLNRETFLKKVKELNSNYWNEGKDYRWEYMSYVIEEAEKLNPKKIIEAGASDMPLNDESFLFNYPKYNLDKVPYDFKDKEFDLFIALQVWEHLNNQAEAFREVMRISKNAILSFPFQWKHGDKRHRGIDKARIKQWTCGVEPVKVKLIKDRIVYVWRFK